MLSASITKSSCSILIWILIGIEYDERLYNTALVNKKNCISSNKVEFVYCNAKDFIIPDDATKAYFFNPFSVEVLKEVIENIKKSKEVLEREFTLFFYYPSKEYLEFLNNNSQITFVEDIECYDLFQEFDPRECIKIYKI